MAATPKPFALSVHALLRNPAGDLLLLRRSARSGHNAGRWEPPGGKVHPDESVGEAVLREVREETGLDATIEAPLGSTSSEVDEFVVLHLFFQAHAGSECVRLSDAHEEYRWVSLDALLDDDLADEFRPFLTSYCRAHGYAKPRRRTSSSLPAISAVELDRHVGRFREVQPRYLEYAEFLRRRLEDAVRPYCPLAEVQARVKSIPSFAEKILRKNKYRDPLTEITDLCGARVVTQIRSEAEAVEKFIAEHFVLDVKNSVDPRSRRGASEFGYGARHYVVELKPGEFGGVPKTLDGLKAEIQVCTTFQHAWSDIVHDRLYKGGYKTPERWVRESARLAAALESVEDGFGRLVEGLEAYRSHFGAYLDRAQIAREMEIVDTVLLHDPENPSLVHRLVRLAMSQDDWDRAVRAVREFQSAYPERVTADLLVCLGSSLCEQHRNHPGGDEFLAGRAWLEQAVKVDASNVEALIRLAETAPDDAQKLACYAEAFAVDPSDPATLEGYTRQKMIVDRSGAFIPLMRPSLEAAIERCALQVSVNVNIPDALYRMAGFRLLLGPRLEWECLTALAQAIRVTQAVSPIDSALAWVQPLAQLEPARRDLRAVERMLRVARQALFPMQPPDPRLIALATPGVDPIPGPVVIVAGGCDAAHEERMAGFGNLLRRSFEGFAGTLLSGGTEQGIPGLVGGLGAAPGSRIRTVGYLPATLPADGTANRDLRYSELRCTDGEREFSALEPLQNWIDLLVSGVRPQDVRVLGINGGRIAGFEYRLAWALGAQVAVVRDSGREVDAFERGIQDGEFEGMLIVPDDACTVRAFLQAGAPGDAGLSTSQQEQLARFAHALFLEENRHRHPDRVMQPWDDLDEDLRASNIEQVVYMTQTLRAAGFELAPVNATLPVREFDAREVDTMAEFEHGRWNAERLRAGWRHGAERDSARKISPNLVAWENLPADIRAWDRNAVRRFPMLLAQVSMQIVDRSVDGGRVAAIRPDLPASGD